MIFISVYEKSIFILLFKRKCMSSFKVMNTNGSSPIHMERTPKRTIVPSFKRPETEVIVGPVEDRVIEPRWNFKGEKKISPYVEAILELQPGEGRLIPSEKVNALYTHFHKQRNPDSNGDEVFLMARVDTNHEGFHYVRRATPTEIENMTPFRRKLREGAVKGHETRKINASYGE